MRRMLLTLLIAAMPSAAFAQAAVQPFVINGTDANGGYTNCPVGTVAAGTCPMPVTITSGTSTTQDTNLKQVGGAAVTLGQGTKSQSIPVTVASDQGLTVTQIPATSGGVSTFSQNITTAGAGAGVGGVAVDVSPGQLYGWGIYNSNSSVCYIQIFDQTQALTNLGTTAPKISMGIPANGGANLAMPIGIPFATAITAGVTTTRAGSTACTNGLDINLLYK